MLIISISLFVIAALLGLIILIAILQNKSTPKPAVFLHGSIALIALISAITYVYSGHTDPLLLTSIALFIMAALGGLTLFSFDMSKKPIPKMIALGHPVLALIALILLVIYLLKGHY